MWAATRRTYRSPEVCTLLADQGPNGTEEKAKNSLKKYSLAAGERTQVKKVEAMRGILW